MRRRLSSVLVALLLAGALLGGAPAAVSAEDCVEWSAEYGCESSITCLLLSETHGACIVYHHRAGTISFLFF
jgi:hypothetical protein